MKHEQDTVVLADDHPIMREGIAALCASHSLKILEQCDDGPEACEAIMRLKPELAILDLQMPGLTGIEVVRRLRASGCDSKLLILSISREQSAVKEVLRSGADAYLLKDGTLKHLLDAISFVREGGVYVTPQLGGILARADQEQTTHPLASLSPREREVFSGLVNGLRPRDIAERLEISPKTVDTYRASLMRKLEVHELAELIKFAIRHGLTST